MTWTATEREAETIGGKAIDIRDDNGDLFCCVYAVLDHSAAVEAMRARARLIVQAEAMTRLVGLLAKHLDWFENHFNAEELAGLDYATHAAAAHIYLADCAEARAIIAATEGDHG